MAEPTTTSTPAEILTALLPTAFDNAHKAGDLFFFQSSARIVPGEFPFEVRTSLALGEKKKATAVIEAIEAAEGPEVKRVRTGAAERPSPFRPPYTSGLFVGCVEGVDGEARMSVLLNKFAILSQHFLLCPVVEQPQNLPPTPVQLAHAYSFLQAGARERKDMLAFYNGGPGAGASQRWRHIQFVEARPPVSEWVRSMVFERQDRAIIHPTLPYLHIVHPLPPSYKVPYPLNEDGLIELADTLAPALMRSLDLAFAALRRSGGDRNQGWNLLLTLDHLHLIPRSAPSFIMEGLTLDINALGYAGMLLVRSEEEAAALTVAADKDGGSLANVVAKCALPRIYGEQALDADATQHGGAGAEFEGL